MVVIAKGLIVAVLTIAFWGAFLAGVRALAEWFGKSGPGAD